MGLGLGLGSGLELLYRTRTQPEVRSDAEVGEVGFLAAAAGVHQQRLHASVGPHQDEACHTLETTGAEVHAGDSNSLQPPLVHTLQRLA